MKTLKVLSVLLISLTIYKNVDAQSGRIIEPPKPTPEILITTESSKVYPPCDKGLEKTLYLSPRKINEFVDELNRLGNCGYRMEKVSKLPLGPEHAPLEMNVFGVVKLDAGNRYEYNWFGASSHGQLQTNANKQAALGFYHRQNLMFIAGRCSSAVEKDRTENQDNPVSVLSSYKLGFNGSMYIFERKNGIVKKREYRVLNGNDNDGDKTLPQNQKNLNDFVARGFRPVGYFYLGYFDVFAILVEKDDDVKPEGDYLIKRQYLGVSKAFTKLAQEGYQPILLGTGFAVLHRKTSAPIQVSYKTDYPYQLIKKLSVWKGAYFQVNGTAGNQQCDPFDGELFFAVPLNAAAPKYDYKFLQMTDVVERITKKKEKNASFSDLPTREKLQEFQTLVSEGYEVREIFYFGELFILFERQL